MTVCDGAPQRRDSLQRHRDHVPGCCRGCTAMAQIAHSRLLKNLAEELVKGVLALSWPAVAQEHPFYIRRSYPTAGHLPCGRPDDGPPCSTDTNVYMGVRGLPAGPP